MCNGSLHSGQLQGHGNANERARQSFRPLALPRLRGDQVLPQLDSDMGKTPPLAMLRDRVIRSVAYGVGLVVADDEPGFRPQTPQQLTGEPCIPVIQHSSVPGTLLAMKA